MTYYIDIDGVEFKLATNAISVNIRHGDAFVGVWSPQDGLEFLALIPTGTQRRIAIECAKAWVTSEVPRL